jgi:ADP-heptose:LPS heptosyltransferase
MTQRQNKILVIRGGAIGDFILTLPVFAALRQHFPQSRLEVLGYPHIAQLALAGGLVDRVQSIEARVLAGFFARGGQLDETLRNYFASVAVIVSFLYDPDAIFQENVARCSKAQFIAGPHRPDESAGIHATTVFLRPVERLAIFDADPRPRLPIRASRTKHRILSLHPGSGSENKNWPEARWAELLQQLVRSTDLKFLIVGGEAEEGRLDRLAALLPAWRYRIARSLPLADLAGHLAECAAYIGHDSGITHLAAALGLPTLALWGESVEEVWRPLGENVTIVRAADGRGLNALSVAAVVERLNQAQLAVGNKEQSAT